MSEEKVTITYDVGLIGARAAGKTFGSDFGRACRAAVEKYDAEQKAKRWDAYDAWRRSRDLYPHERMLFLRDDAHTSSAKAMANCFGALDRCVDILKDLEGDEECPCVACDVCSWSEEQREGLRQAVAAMIPDDIARGLFGVQ